jgi:glycosyltransferase involved in cell wall biosynthesis
VANIIEDGRLGGPQIRILEIARQLQKKDSQIHTVVIFPYEDGKDFRQLLDNAGVEHIQLPLHRLSRGKEYVKRYLLFFPYEIWLLFRVLRKHRFDVVHVSGGSWQYKGLIAGRMTGCKVLWHFNDTRMHPLLRFVCGILARLFADGFIVSGKRVKAYYIENMIAGTAKPVFEIQAPVDCTVFSPENLDSDPKISSHSGINIVSVGNINPWKGFEYFLYAAMKLNKKYSFLHYQVVGPCFNSQKKYFRRLEKIRQDSGLKNFTFYGNCTDVRNVLQSADIYLCSSIAEASPISVWEAMAMGKPVVAADVGDIGRFIKDGYNGFIVPPEDFSAMADKIAMLVDDADLRKTFGKRARETALGCLDAKRSVQGHCNAYKQITAEPI